MTDTAIQVSDLRHTAYTAGTIAGIKEFLRVIDDLHSAEKLPLDAYSELRFLAFNTLHRISEGDFLNVKELVLKDLLPWCLQNYESGSKADLNIYRCRDLFAKWINELPSAHLGMVLEDVLQYLITGLNGTTLKTACWTIGDIGFQQDRVKDALRGVVQKYPGEEGDAALAVLCELAVLPAEREEYVAAALQRFRQRQHNPTYFMLQMLGTGRVLEFIGKLLNGGEPNSGEPKPEPISLLSIIAHIADAQPDDPEISNLAASLVEQIYERSPNDTASRLAIAGNILPAIDSSRVANIFANLFLATASDVGQRLHAIYVQTLRLQESVRPQQLAGLSGTCSAKLMQIFKDVILMEGESTGPNRSLLGDAKKNVLWSALTLESGEPLQWLSELMTHEKDPYVLHELMQAYGCFRIEPLSEKIKLLILENFDGDKNGEAGNWLIRTDALRIARSAASREAFEALLSPGFTLGGTVLLDTVQSLAEVALDLARDVSTRNEIALLLLDALESSHEGPKRSAAVHTILNLASAGYLPTSAHHRLLHAAFQSDQKDYDQSRLLEALVYAQVDISQPLVDRLRTWTTERKDRVGDTAQEMLIRLDEFDFHVTCISPLGLRDTGSGVRWDSAAPGISRWTPFFIGLLFERSPDMFGRAVEDVLLQGDWQQCSQIYPILLRVAHLKKDISWGGVRDALISRLVRSITSTHAELHLVKLAAEVAPEDFLVYDWPASLNGWFVDARIQFADAICLALQHSNSDVARDKGVSFLISLTDDSQYGVRRSTFRALSYVDPGALRALTVTLARSDQYEQRIRAAEAAGWIPDHDLQQKEWMELVGSIETDVHKRVRSAFVMSMKLKRQRKWTKDYLDRLTGLSCPTNAEMLRVWRYGWALAKLGDDETIWRLEDVLSGRDITPNVRHFIGLIHRSTEREWNETRKKWPDPVFPLKGTVETGKGRIIANNKDWQVNYILWGKAAEGPTKYGQWGGYCRTETITDMDKMFAKDIKILTEDGRSGTALVQGLSNLTELVLCGNGEYPS